MSNGYGANCAQVVSEEFLRSRFESLFNAFVSACERADFDIDSRFDLLGIDDESAPDSVLSSYQALVSAFVNEFGLPITLMAHKVSEDGDCYDDVDGHFWAVDGVYTKSPQALAIENTHGSVFETVFLLLLDNPGMTHTIGAQLQTLVDQHNWIASNSRGEFITLPLSKEHTRSLYTDLLCQSSPENLHCDGEASDAEVHTKIRFITLAHRQLRDADSFGIVGDLDDI